MRKFIRVIHPAFLIVWSLAICAAAQAGELRQVVSREHPAIQGTGHAWE